MKINLKKMKPKRIKIIIFAVLAAAFAVFTAAVNNVEKVPIVSAEGQTFEKAVVTEIIKDNIQADGSREGNQKVRVRMLSGLKKGQTLETTSSSGYLFGAGCTKGMKVIIMQSVSGESTVSSVYSQDREWVIYIFAGLYLLALLLVGGKQGLKGSFGLIFTFFCMIFVYLPLIYRGAEPFWAAVFVCCIITFATMYLIGGATRKTVAATIGTVGGVVISGVAAVLFSLVSGVTGYNVSNIESLMSLWEITGVKVGGLLFSGMLISSLGAVMDVAMSISSAMNELSVQNKDITRKELCKAGLHVGRDMMGTDSNTLILAFAGSSVSMLVLNYAYNLPYRQIINSNAVGIAVLQGLAGSFGIVLSVPLTVAAAAYLYTAGKPVKNHLKKIQNSLKQVNKDNTKF